MGDRAILRFDFGSGKPPLFLYAHWAGSELMALAKKATESKAAKGRVGDVAYYARIVLTHILHNGGGGELGTKEDGGTGWGLSTDADDLDNADHGCIGTVDCVNGGVSRAGAGSRS